MKTCKGFTLPELLVAVALLGVIALLSYRGVEGMRHGLDLTEAHAARWQEIARGVDRLVSDIRQPGARYSPGNKDVQTDWSGKSSPDGDSFIFARRPYADGYPEQRIGYRLSHGVLELQIWTLDTTGTTGVPSSASYSLIEGVMEFQVRYLGNDLRWIDHWPSGLINALPRAVKFHLMLNDGRTVDRMVTL